MSLFAKKNRSALQLGAIAASIFLGAATLALPGVANAATVLKVATSSAVTTWDPIQSFSTEAFYMTNIYEPLLWKNADGSKTEFTPAIATSWSHSTDGLTWTFKIRQGATFHDGSAVTAAAVKASLETAKKTAGASFIWDPVKTFDAPSVDTLVMNLTYSAPMDLIASSTYGAWIVSPAALAALAKDPKYFESGIDGGTGPYKIQSYKAGSEVVLAAYSKHWSKVTPAYSIVDALITPDGVTAQQMMTSGQVDWSSNIPLTSIASLKIDPKYTVKTYASPFNFVGYFNTLRAPLNNPKVRQAISWAIPYRDIVAIGGQGFGSQARGPVPRGIFPFDPKTPYYAQNLGKAKKMLADAHVRDLKLKITFASENSSEARFVPLIQSALESIGVKVEIQAMLFNQQWAAAKKDPANAQDIFIVYYWPTYSDAGADNLYSLFHSSAKPFFNLSYWKSPEYDALIEKASSLAGSDREASQAAYSQSMKMLFDQAPGIYLYDQKQVTVVPKSLSLPVYNINYPFSAFFAGAKPTGR